MQADKQYDAFVKALTSAAEANIGEYFFILVDPPGNSHALSFFGLKEDATPAFVLQDGNDKYISSQPNPSEISAFLKEFEVGRGTSHL